MSVTRQQPSRRASLTSLSSPHPRRSQGELVEIRARVLSGRRPAGIGAESAAESASAPPSHSVIDVGVWGSAHGAPRQLMRATVVRLSA